MRASEYTAMFNAETEHWWYKNLRDEVAYWVEAYLSARQSERPLRVLDLGCGTGGMLQRLQKQFENVQTVGVDFYALALDFARNVTKGPLIRADAKRLPFQPESFDIIVCLDVLYTREVFPALDRVLAEARQLLKPGGMLIMQVPAFKSLYSQHDVNVHGVYRFTAPEIQDGLQRAGFRRLKVYYRYNLLLGIAWLSRKVFSANGTASHVAVPTAWLNTGLYKYSKLESAINKRCRLPFGLSVFATAYRALLALFSEELWFIETLIVSAI